MGKIFAKLKVCCCCCCFCGCCCSSTSKRCNRARVLPLTQHYKVLLLGLSGSGKTELGHTLSGKGKRIDYDPTNGVQYYESTFPEPDGMDNGTAGGGKLCITEIGGNEEMQKLWQLYFMSTMAIIYCVDISAEDAILQKSFDTLRAVAGHQFVRGKPILLVVTKLSLRDREDSLQLYDIENAFQLETLAQSTTCSLRICSYEGLQAPPTQLDSLMAGIQWLATFLTDNQDLLQLRLKCDENMNTWRVHSKKLLNEGKLRKYYRYSKRPRNLGHSKFWQRSGRIRPRTAPPLIYSISSSLLLPANASQQDEELARQDLPPPVKDLPTAQRGSSNSVPNALDKQVTVAPNAHVTVV